MNSSNLKDELYPLEGSALDFLAQNDPMQAFEVGVHALAWVTENEDRYQRMGELFEKIAFSIPVEEYPQLTLQACSIALFLLTDTSENLYKLHARAAQACGELDDPDGAYAHLYQQFELTPLALLDNSPEGVMTDLALLLIDRGRYNEAIHILEKIVDEGKAFIQGDELFYIDTIAWLYYKAEKPQAALDFLASQYNAYVDEALNIWISRLYTIYARLQGSEVYKEALNYIIEQNEINLGKPPFEGGDFGYYVESLIMLGEIEYLEEKYVEATQTFQRAISADQNAVDGWRGLARCQMKQGQLNDLAITIGVVVSLSAPNNTLTEIEDYSLLADFCFENKEYEAALNYADSGLKMFNSRLPGTNEIAEYPNNYYKIGQEEFTNLITKLEQQNKLFRSQGTQVSLYLRKVDALVHLDRLDHALDVLEIARRELPGQEQFYSYAIILLLKMERLEQAKHLIDQFSNTGLPFSEKMIALRDKISQNPNQKSSNPLSP